MSRILRRRIGRIEKTKDIATIGAGSTEGRGRERMDAESARTRETDSCRYGQAGRIEMFWLLSW